MSSTTVVDQIKTALQKLDVAPGTAQSSHSGWMITGNFAPSIKANLRAISGLHTKRDLALRALRPSSDELSEGLAYCAL
jgi:hypothetical protein